MSISLHSTFSVFPPCQKYRSFSTLRFWRNLPGSNKLNECVKSMIFFTVRWSSMVSFVYRAFSPYRSSSPTLRSPRRIQLRPAGEQLLCLDFVSKHRLKNLPMATSNCLSFKLSFTLHLAEWMILTFQKGYTQVFLSLSLPLLPLERHLLSTFFSREMRPHESPLGYLVLLFNPGSILCFTVFADFRLLVYFRSIWMSASNVPTNWGKMACYVFQFEGSVCYKSGDRSENRHLWITSREPRCGTFLSLCSQKRKILQQWHYDFFVGLLICWCLLRWSIKMVGSVFDRQYRPSVVKLLSGGIFKTEDLTSFRMVNHFNEGMWAYLITQFPASNRFLFSREEWIIK